MLFEINKLVPIRVEKKFIEKIIRSAFFVLRISSKAKISLAIVDNKTIRRLNRIWRGKDRATDILTFSFRKKRARAKTSKGFKSPSSEYLGEIIISLPGITKRSQKEKISFQKSFARLLIHGLVHLGGYNHKGDKEAQIMEGVEDKIFKEIH